MRILVHACAYIKPHATICWSALCAFYSKTNDRLERVYIGIYTKIRSCKMYNCLTILSINFVILNSVKRSPFLFILKLFPHTSGFNGHWMCFYPLLNFVICRFLALLFDSASLIWVCQWFEQPFIFLVALPWMSMDLYIPYTVWPFLNTMYFNLFSLFHTKIEILILISIIYTMCIDEF